MFILSELKNIEFPDILDKFILQDSTLKNMDLSNKRIKASYFGYSDFINTNFKNSDLSEYTDTMIFPKSEVSYLEWEQLRPQISHVANVSLIGVKEINGDVELLLTFYNNFHHADLEDVEFEGANLEGADFSFSNLKGANLKNANLNNVFFVNANLEGANLEGANLEGANLEGANLKCINNEICN